MKARLFHLWSVLCTLVLLVSLSVFLGFILYRGAPTISIALFFGDASPIDAVLGRELSGTVFGRPALEHFQS